MNKSDFNDSFYIVSFILKTNILVPNKGDTKTAIDDGTKAMNNFIHGNFVDIKNVKIETISKSTEDRINYVITEEEELEKGDGYIASN